MYVSAYLRGVGNNIYKFIRQILWMARHEPDPLNPVDTGDFPEKVRKSYLLIKSASVWVDILAEEHYLFDTVCGKITDLDVPATLPEHIALPGHVTEECQVSLCGLCPNCQEEPV